MLPQAFKFNLLCEKFAEKNEENHGKKEKL